MATYPKLKTKTDEIVDRLNLMVNTGDANEFELKMVEAEAQKLKATDLEAAFTILGMVECLRRNIEEMHAAHKNAIAYSKDSPHTIAQYAVSLKNAGFFEEALEWGEKAHSKDPSDTVIIEFLIRTAAHLGRNKTLASLLVKWEKLTGKEYVIENAKNESGEPSMAEIKNKIKAYFNSRHGDIIDYVDLADNFDFALPMIVQACDELEAEGKIRGVN